MRLLPESLVERLKTRQAVLVTGLGCAEVAGLPSWSGLCERMAEWIEEEGTKRAFLALVQEGRLASATALLREIVAPDALLEVLVDAYPPGTAVPESFRELAQAPWRAIVTAGYDALWPTAFAEQGVKPERIALAATAASIEPGRGRFLIQLFGRPDVPDSLCLAPCELVTKIVAPKAADLLLSLHKKWSFVFLGFRPGDPDLVMLARLLGASPSTQQHYFVAPGLSPWQARQVKAELGLDPVTPEASSDEIWRALAEACRLGGDKPPADNVEAWLERLTADPADEEAQEMLDQGLQALRESHEWERFVAALIGRVEIEPDPARQAADLHRAAMALDQELSAPDRAFSVLLMAVRLIPYDAELLADTRRIAEAAGQSKELNAELAVIEREAAGTPEADRVSLAVAKLWAEDPARQDEAAAAYQKVVDRAPDDREAIAGLEAVLRKNQRWDALAALFTKVAQRDPGNPEVAAKLEEIFERTHQNTPLVELLSDRLAQQPDHQPTLAKLATLHQKKQDWNKLAALHQQALERNPDDAVALAKLEDVYKQTQRWPELGALYEKQLAKHPDDDTLPGKLDELYRRSEQWKALADLLERRAAERSPDEARPLRLERASIVLDKLKDTEAALAIARAFLPGDTAAAEEIFAKCIERDGQSPAPLLAMADLARDKGDHLRAAKFLLDAAARTQNPLELGRLFTQAGIIHQENLQDEARAIECFAGALAADPEQVKAARALLGLREQREDWAGAEPLYELLLRKATDGSDKLTLYRGQARCAQKLGKLDKAAVALTAARDLDTASFELARELGDVHFARSAWADARTEYERAQGLLPEGADPAVAIALYERLAVSALKSEDQDAALDAYAKVLALEPGKRETLAALVELRTARDEWAEVIALTRKLLAVAADDAERARVLETLGDLLREKQNDWPAAMEAYQQALALEPDRRQVLYKTLDHYTQEKDWDNAVATLQKLADLEAEPAGRAQLNYALAAVYRDEIKDTAKAAQQFAKVLDDQPLYPKAFEAIEKLLGEAKQWKELERAYRKQIKRLPQDAPAELKLRLWDNLAEVALRLHDKESAMVTMEVALKLEPDNFARQERLAKMYFDMGPSQADKAIAQHQLLLVRKPDRIESYKALAALFFQAGAHDKMWCVAGAMTYLGKADPPLRSLYENCRPSQTRSASKLSGELWRQVVHPDENAYLGALLGLLSPALAMTTAQPQKILGEARNARVDLSTDAWPYAAALRYVASTTESAVPDVYFKRDAPGTVSVVNLKDKNKLAPALVVGIGFAQLTSQSEVIFDLSKRMVQLRPERFARFALTTASALDIAVRAGLQLGGCPIGPGDHGGEVDKMAKQIDGLLASPLRAELKVLAKRYVEACGSQVDIAKWIVASDLTASRAALVLCGDIVAASRVLSIEPTGTSPLSPAERMNDLLPYFVSNGHFAVRAALGMQVNLPPPAEPLPPGPRPRHMSHMQIKAQGG